MRFSPFPLAAVAATLLLAAPTYGQEQAGIPASPAATAAQTAAPARAEGHGAVGRVPARDTPRAVGRKPCRKPSGERVTERSDDMDEFSDFDKR